jgi:hypothetical protein
VSPFSWVFGSEVTDLCEVGTLALLGLELALELLYLHLLLVAAVHPDVRLLLHLHPVALLYQLRKQAKRKQAKRKKVQRLAESPIF